MEQAVIAILDEHGKPSEQMSVQFNPADYSLDQSVSYTEAKGLAANNNNKKSQFTAETSPVLKIKLTFDGFTKANTLDPEQAADVNKSIVFLRKLVTVNENMHRPPMCSFAWGSLRFIGAVKQLSVNYTMFASTGKPIRATADMTIGRADNKKIALNSPDRTKRRVLTQDTPLYTVAYEAYNDPGEWRRIAVANGIKNPRRLHAGTVLKIPPMEFETL
jgi:hypothetical protein